MQNLNDVDWTKIPVPGDDGEALHLSGAMVPSIRLDATNGSQVNLSALKGLSVVYIYPRTGRPDQPHPAGWNSIPGARGCTPQSCAFRDRFNDLKNCGANFVFGLSVQSTAYQQEAVSRMHLPFSLLSDRRFKFSGALNLPTFEADGMTLLKRMTLIVRDGKVANVFYPVFPPDRDVESVIGWLKGSNF